MVARARAAAWRPWMEAETRARCLRECFWETWGEELTARRWQRGDETSESKKPKPACVRVSKIKREAPLCVCGARVQPSQIAFTSSHGLAAAPLQCGPCPTGGRRPAGPREWQAHLSVTEVYAVGPARRVCSVGRFGFDAGGLVPTGECW
jgi:hypothetical protein